MYKVAQNTRKASAPILMMIFHIFSADALAFSIRKTEESIKKKILF